FALAGLTAAALDVEAESAGAVAAFARFSKHGIELADRREQTGVGSGVRSRCAADGRLVNHDDLVKVLHPLDGTVWSRFLDRAIKLLGDGPVENVVHQGGLAGTRDSGHDGKQA